MNTKWSEWTEWQIECENSDDETTCKKIRKRFCISSNSDTASKCIGDAVETINCSIKNPCFGSINIKSNSNYTLIGTVCTDPKSKATILFDQAIPAQDNIELFKMTPEIKEKLKVFTVNESQKLSDKLDEIYNDLSVNVTRVWERNAFLFGVDLIYHSVLNFYFQNEFVTKGWITGLC